MMSGREILFTTVHVITDWPISDYMNRDLTQRSHTSICVPLWTGDTRSVFRYVLWERTQAEDAGAIYEQQPTPALLPSGCLYTWARWEVVKRCLD
ncbi:unnamed protein product [Staurois parvus]|uniref:Uncharacterized protein n=1 Tax=Staurois parvus TaxID=386267 RepID=A0ABN9D976_9NEOB|nr:unnamed protein product [Staurois parvus]